MSPSIASIEERTESKSESTAAKQETQAEAEEATLAPASAVGSADEDEAQGPAEQQPPFPRSAITSALSPESQSLESAQSPLDPPKALAMAVNERRKSSINRNDLQIATSLDEDDIMAGASQEDTGDNISQIPARQLNRSPNNQSEDSYRDEQADIMENL